MENPKSDPKEIRQAIAKEFSETIDQQLEKSLVQPPPVPVRPVARPKPREHFSLDQSPLSELEEAIADIEQFMEKHPKDFTEEEF
ncbi:MAG: hypothetical protein ACRC2J_17390 [Microcoleaceae cyanobacterium]